MQSEINAGLQDKSDFPRVSLIETLEINYSRLILHNDYAIQHSQLSFTVFFLPVM